MIATLWGTSASLDHSSTVHALTFPVGYEWGTWREGLGKRSFLPKSALKCPLTCRSVVRWRTDAWAMAVPSWLRLIGASTDYTFPETLRPRSCLVRGSCKPSLLLGICLSLPARSRKRSLRPLLFKMAAALGAAAAAGSDEWPSVGPHVKTGAPVAPVVVDPPPGQPRLANPFAASLLLVSLSVDRIRT